MDNDLARSALSVTAAAAVLVVVFGVLWARTSRAGRISLVDVAWGAGFPVVAVVALLVSGTGDPDQLTRWLLVALPATWGLRLAIHNGRRLARHDTEDPRYQDLIDGSPQSRPITTLVKVAVPQAASMLVVSLPITIGANNADSFWPLTMLGVVVWAVGVFFETVGDVQLERFKAQRDSQDEVLETGLWRYTRHPNYFGDVCNWWGIWLVSAYSWAGLASALGPALMTYLIVAKTGSRLTEQKMADSRPGYADYVARTSSFFPLPPRSVSGGRDGP